MFLSIREGTRLPPPDTSKNHKAPFLVALGLLACDLLIVGFPWAQAGHKSGSGSRRNNVAGTINPLSL